MANDINKEDPHYKGEYGCIYEVNRKFPTGGVAGDFVVIDGWAHYWNAVRGTWCVNAERDSYWDELITNIIEKFKLVRGATFMGVASLETVPTKVIGAKMYYFATAAGTYKNFDNLVVPQGINVLYSENGSSWVNTTLLEVAQELGVSTNKVMSQKAVSDELSDLSKYFNDKLSNLFSKTPYVSQSTLGGVYSVMINVKSGDKYHYQGSVDNGKWGITMYSDAALSVVSKTLVEGKGSVKLDVEGIFEQDGWCVVYNRNFINNFGLFEVFKPIVNITSKNKVEDLNDTAVTEYDIKADNGWIYNRFSVKKGDILSIATTGDKNHNLLQITSMEDSANIFTIPFVERRNLVNLEVPFDGIAKVANRGYESALSSCVVIEKENYLTSQSTTKEREHFVFPQTSLPWDTKSFDVFKGEIANGFLYGDPTKPNAIIFTAKSGEEKVIFIFDGVYQAKPLQFSYNITEDGTLTLNNRSYGGHFGEVHIESSIEQNISALQSGFNELANKVKSATSYDFNVKTYGAKGDGIADDTDAIQAAIDACCKAGGGTVFIPNGIYRLHKVQSRTDGTYTKTGHLFIPVTSNLENRITLKIKGESAVQYTTFYVNSRMGTGVTGNKGTTLYSDYLPDDTSKALDNPISVITSIGWKNGGIPQNVTIVKMESFNICTKCSDLGYPFVSGIDGSLMAQLDCRDMDIRTDGLVKNLKKSPTGHICFGIMIGANLDDPHQSLDYINISQGFNYGLISGLHLTARCVDIQTCINAFTFSKGGHFSEFSLVTIHHCANNIVCLDKEFDNVKIGATRVLFHLFNYETQIGSTPSDFGFQKAVVDPNNYIFGKCDYFLGWSATGSNEWTMDGGRNLKCTSL